MVYRVSHGSHAWTQVLDAFATPPRRALVLPRTTRSESSPAAAPKTLALPQAGLAGRNLLWLEMCRMELGWEAGVEGELGTCWGKVKEQGSEKRGTVIITASDMLV